MKGYLHRVVSDPWIGYDPGDDDETIIAAFARKYKVPLDQIEIVRQKSIVKVRRRCAG